MSGAEALIVLGIIANFASIIDFTDKVFSRIKDVGDNIHDIPRAFRDVQITLPLLADALKRMQQGIELGTLHEEACRALKPVLLDCQSAASKLNEIFDKSLPKDNSSKIHHVWKAILTLKQDKKVEDLSELIQKRVPLLTLHHIITSGSSAVDSVSAGIAALQVAEAQRPKTYTIVPVQWADDFTGRGEQMSTLSSKLDQPGKHVRVAIVGLGGIGKTRLARQYIEAQNRSNTSVFWIHAGTAERMKGGSRDIAKKVGIPGCDDPNVDILGKVKEWLESEASGRWLLIYDNVDDIDLMYGEGRGRLAAYFPRSNRGSIIMTTRNRQIGIKFATAKYVVSLSALDLNESITLMATKLGDEESERRPDLVRLAEALGGVPLALVQAASFIHENESTPARYLELYEANDQNRIELLSQDFEDDTRDSELKNPIASTWIVTFEYLKEHQPLAANTLCIMSMFDAQAIPEALISKTAEGDSSSPTSLERTLGALLGYSLISLRHTTGASGDQVGRVFNLHRLVRLVTRNWLTMCSTHDDWVAETIDVMSTAYDTIEKLDFDVRFSTKSRYLPHALSLISSRPLLLQDDDEVFVPTVFHGQKLQDDHTIKGVICPTCTGNILAQMVDRYHGKDQRLRMIKKAIAICTFALGPKSVITLQHRSDEGHALWTVLDRTNAEIVYRELLADYTSTLGPKHRRTLQVGDKLAQVMQELGNSLEAERLLLQLIETSSHEYGQEDEMTVLSMQNLVDNIIDQGRHEEAGELILKISDLVNTVPRKVRLAIHYLSMSRYSDLETLCLSLLDDMDSLSRDGCIDDIWSLLAEAYSAQSLYDRAEGLRRQVVTYRQKNYGENTHVSSFKILLSLAGMTLPRSLYDLL
ncbi:MAG: hypothetical protein Q9172_001115 [Xanthocarpia lactea]